MKGIMKKTLLSLALCFVMVLALSLVPGTVTTAHAASSVAINSANFPDENFRNYVKENFDKDGDDILSVSEMVAVKEIKVNNRGISSLQGVEFFNRLQGLACSDNRLTALDLTHNTLLNYLDCQHNQLKELDLHANIFLTDVDCDDNALTVLNVSHNPGLNYLDCNDNQLTSLDVSKCTGLIELYCSSNQLAQLDVSNNTALTDLSCALNQLSALNLGANAKLKALNCNGNQLAVLDISECPQMINTYTNAVWIDDSGDSILYALYGTNKFLSVDKTTELITSAPVITTQPRAQTVKAGEKVTFSVEATGGGLTYQWWYKAPDGEWTKVKVNGTSATYTLKAQERHNGYKYRCRVYNAAGVAPSDIVKLTVKVSAPVITTQPKAQTAAAGKTATFSVKATGGGLTYQWWYKAPGGEWTKVKVNGTSATYTLKTEERHNGYKYRCRVYNAAGVAASDIVTLTVVTQPTITTQPVSKTVKAGQTATLKVTATGGGLSYQWYFLKPGTTTWSKVKVNGTSATYSLTAEARHNGYKYKCVITNLAGAATSKIVTLTVK